MIKEIIVYNRTGNLYYIKSDTGEKKVFSVMPYDKLGFIDKERYYIVHDSEGLSGFLHMATDCLLMIRLLKAYSILHPIRVSLLYWLPIICNV